MRLGHCQKLLGCRGFRSGHPCLARRADGLRLQRGAGARTHAPSRTHRRRPWHEDDAGVFADGAFAAFEEAGGAFDAERAEALETHILSTGGSRDPAELYTAFRGRLPGVEALLKGRGLAA